MFAAVCVGCFTVGCNGDPVADNAVSGKLTNGDSKELWPIENGYCVLLVCHNDDQKWDARPIFGRAVFDINTLPRSYALRKKWITAMHGDVLDKAPEDKVILNWDELSNKERAIDLAEWWSLLSKASLQAAQESPSTPQDLVEVILSNGGGWYFSRLRQADGRIVREDLCKADQQVIEKYLFLAKHGPYYRLRAVRWGFTYLLTGSESCNDYEKAKARFVVRWRGHEYSGAAVADEAILSVPGLGPVATGEFRPGVPFEKRVLAGHPVILCVPSRNIHIVDPKVSFKIIREIKN